MNNPPKYFSSASLVAAVAAVFALVGSGCAKPAPVASAPPMPVVKLAPVVYTNETAPVRATGVLARIDEAELSFKIGGVIDAIGVRAGDSVRQGDLLAKLRLDEIEAQVVQARSAWEKAQRDAERVNRLHANHVATMENAQDAATAVELAAAALRIAQFNREHAVIVAPAAGKILTRSAEPNEIVSPGHTILTFGADDSGWLVRVGLSQRDVSRVRVRDRVEVSRPEAPEEKIAGAVTHIAEAADPSNRLTETEITLERPPADVRSGYVVTVAIQPAAVDARPSVPISALVEGDGHDANLFLVEKGGGFAQRKRVHIAEWDGDRVFLSTPVPRDARVVVSGAEYLTDGARFQASND